MQLLLLHFFRQRNPNLPSTPLSLPNPHHLVCRLRCPHCSRKTSSSPPLQPEVVIPNDAKLGRRGSELCVVSHFVSPFPLTSHFSNNFELKLRRMLENCSCVAYAKINVNASGKEYVIWFGDLFDIREVPVYGQDLYVRVSQSSVLFEMGLELSLTRLKAFANYAFGMELPQLVPPLLQETTWLVVGSSSTSKVLVKNGGGPIS
ncbi:hypothetical protein PIB30_051888 [Stylosanthes scabra]|uniref:Apple domain-containing protein n=1 Tax=Stylosanthes scabra TaxID=79078 RepID=A0ABU6VHB2_9FABA|nr:hypothetical protein [Stylosanthes scabra]